MPVLKPDEPLETREPVLLVENELAPGTYTFRLVVVSSTGATSDPVDARVTVARGRITTDPTRPRRPDA